MADYIMRKLGDGMHGDHEKQYPKLLSRGEVGFEEIAAEIEHSTTFTRGEVSGMLSALASVVTRAMSQGQVVKLDGLGRLSPVLGLVPKEERRKLADKDVRTKGYSNVRLKTISFRPDSKLMLRVNDCLQLHCVGAEGEARPLTMSMEERTAAARKYLEANGYLRVADYKALTGLSRQAAARELRSLAADPESGITSRGNRAGKIYLLRR